VRECGGFVDKFIGDALLVVFGLFDANGAGDPGAAGSAGAAAAVRCATRIGERLEQLNRRRIAAGKQALAVTTAVHSGEVVAGVIGAQDRHEYTVVGDTVNVAARLQQIAKDHDATVVSQATFELARAAGAEMKAARIDPVFLRGRSEPVTVHVLGARSDTAEPEPTG